MLTKNNQVVGRDLRLPDLTHYMSMTDPSQPNANGEDEKGDDSVSAAASFTSAPGSSSSSAGGRGAASTIPSDATDAEARTREAANKAELAYQELLRECKRTLGLDGKGGSASDDSAVII